MTSPLATTSYMQLLKLVSPEAVVVITALVVLAIGLASSRATVVAGVSSARPPGNRNGTAAAKNWCVVIACAGLASALGAVLMLPRNAALFGGMLVISPLT